MSDSSVFPVRCLSGRWEVFVDDPKRNEWVETNSEREARLISRSRSRWEAVLRNEIRGNEVSQELVETAEIIHQKLGSCIAERICRSAAKKAIENQP
jgi:hypothetical protein